MDTQNQQILVLRDFFFNEDLHDKKAKLFLHKNNKELLIDLELFKHPSTIIRFNEKKTYLMLKECPHN